MIPGFLILVILTTINNFSFVLSANILALFPIVSPSHHIWNSPLVIALAQNGHNVTVLSPDTRTTKVSNVTDLTIDGSSDDEFSYEALTRLSSIQQIEESYNFMAGCCKNAIKSSGFEQLMNYHPDTKFDLIIIEASAVECLLGVIPRFGYPKIVIISAYNIPASVLEITGSPNFPSYMPHYWNPSMNEMAFVDRMWNFYINMHTYFLYHYKYLTEMDRVAQEYFGPDTLPAWQMLKNVSIAISNYHPAFDYPWPLPPNIIPGGGLQIKDPKPLPSDLQKFLDEAVDGAIFFSLGSNIQSSGLSQIKLKEILSAFSELPQRVLWKFESNSIQDLPINVRINKWFAQSDILAHPNVQLFISHCGLLSSHEAVHRAVPVVGVPFFADQHINVRRLVDRGAGLLLEYQHLSKEALLTAINTVLHNASYKENIRRLSEIFRDNPKSPLETAVFWLEYVIRHNGAPHLQPGSVHLNLFQYLLLDVIAFLLIVPSALVSLLLLFCRRKGQKSYKEKRN